MDVVNRIAAPGFKKGSQDKAIRGLSRILLYCFPDKVRLQREVTPQGGIAAADDLDLLAQAFCLPKKIFHQLPVKGSRLLPGQAPGIGQDIKHAAFFRQGLMQALPVPSGIDRNVMNGLDPGRIVIENGPDEGQALYIILNRGNNG